MKIFHKEKKANGRRHIYLFGVKVLSYKAKNKALNLNLYNPAIIVDKSGLFYKGNPEFGLCSLEIRSKETNGKMEYPDMIAANQAIGENFIKDARKIVNIGSGVGSFEYYNAPQYPQTQFIASEFDKTQRDWSIQNRSFENVVYTGMDISKLIQKYGQFDLAVCIDVLEHIKDYGSFLREFVQLAPHAIIATPNRDRYSTIDSLEKPPYEQHPQEWNSGELYWLLKAFYQDVKLYSLPDPLKKDIIPIGIYSTYEKIIAECKNKL